MTLVLQTDEHGQRCREAMLLVFEVENPSRATFHLQTNTGRPHLGIIYAPVCETIFVLQQQDRPRTRPAPNTAQMVRVHGTGTDQQGRIDFTPSSTQVHTTIPLR